MNYVTARRNIVENQVRSNKVTNPTLIGALSSLPREDFVPDTLRGVAYVDEALPLSDSRYLMEPMVLALLLQHAEISPTDIVMEIAPGTGYSTAVIASLASTVVAVETDEALAERATANLVKAGIDNAAVMTGPFAEGYRKQSPYHVIIISGRVEEVPGSLVSQIADGGRLITVVGNAANPGKGILYRKFGRSISSSEVFEAGTPMLPGFARRSEFAL